MYLSPGTTRASRAEGRAWLLTPQDPGASGPGETAQRVVVGLGL